MSARIEHKWVDGVEQKHCGRCGCWLALTNFPKDKSVWDHLSCYCRECLAKANRATYERRAEEIAARTSKWRKAHPEKVVAYARKWQKAHPEKVATTLREWYKKHPEVVLDQSRNRRARTAEAEGTFTVAEFKALCEATGNRCLSPDMDHEGPLVPDHVVPLSRGGRNDISNIQPLCRSCNSTKGTRTIDFRVGFEAT